MSSQGGGGGVSSGNFPINITGNASGLDAIIRSVQQYEQQLIRAAMASNNFAASAGKVGPTLAGAGGGATQFASSMKGANTTMDQFTGSSNQASGAAKTFQSSTLAMGAATGSFANSTNQANGSAKTYQSTIMSLGQGTGTFANQTNNANNSAKGFQSTLVGLGQGTGTLSTNMGQANEKASGFQKTTIGLGQATGTLKTNLDGTSTGFKDMGDTAEAASNKTTSSINNAGAAVTSMVGKVSGLFIGFTGLKMAMEEAAGMQDMLKAAQEKVAKATERVNMAIEQYGRGSNQATQATQALEKAQNGLAFAERNTNFAIGDTYYFLAMLSTQILSSVVPALIKWKETKEQIVGALSFLKTHLSELPGKIAAKMAATTADTAAETANAAATNASGLAKVRATFAAIGLAISHKASAASAAIHGAAMGGLTAMVTAATGAMARLRLAMLANMAVLGPIIIVLAALALAIGAIATDFMGTRTALEGFGKSLGDTVPILKPFLDGIQGIGGALGLTGETAEETQTHFDRMSIGFQNVGTLWHDTIALMQNSNIALVQDVGFTVAGVSTQLATMNTEFEGQIGMSIDTWNKFVHALSQGDFSGAVDILTEALSAIPAILSRIGQRVGELINEIMKGLRAIGTDLYKEFSKVGAALQGLFGEIGKRIAGWLGNIAAEIMAWVNTNIVEPILGFLDSIGIPATEIWTAIVGSATSLVSQVTAWVTENIVNPILGFIDLITSDPQAIFNAILGSATSIVNQVTAWVTENIVNPILGFLDLIKSDPTAIFTAILGTATSILSNVETWVTTNIVTPILDIPNQLRDIVADIIKKLGISGATSPGEVAAFVLKIAMDIMTLPSKIAGKAVEIVKALLTGDWWPTVKKFLDDIWAKMFGWLPGQGAGAEANATVTPSTPGTNSSQTPTDANKDTVYNPNTKMFEKIPTTTTGPSNQTPGVSSGPGPLLYAGGNASNAQKDMQLQRQLGKPIESPWARFGGSDPFTPKAPALPTTTVSPGLNTGIRNVAGSEVITPSNAFQQQNPNAQKLQGSGMDVNKLTEETNAIKEQTATYAQAKANLDEWAKSVDSKAGSSEKQLALGAQEILQNKEMIGVYGANQGAVEALGKQLEAKEIVLEGVDKKNAELRGSIVGTTLAMADGTLQGKLAEQGYLEQTSALQKMEMETIKNTSSLNTYSKQIQDGRIQQVAFTLGEQEQQRALYDKEVALSKNAGRLKEYGQQIQEGHILNLAFTEGQQGQTQALYDSQVAISETNGRLTEYISQIQSGQQQQVAFTQGQQSIVEQFANTIVETSNLIGQYSALKVALDSTTASAIMFINGLAQGRAETAQHIISMDQMAGSYIGSRNAMGQYISGMYTMVDTMNMSNDAIDQWISVSKGVPEAVNAMIDSFKEFGNSAVTSLAEAMKEGKKEVKDALEQIEKDIGDSLTGGEVRMIKVQAETESAVTEIKSSFGLAFKWVMDQELIIGKDVNTEEFQKNVTERMGETMGKVQEQIDNSSGIIKTAWGNVFNTMKDLSTPEKIMDKNAWISGANDIAASLHTIGMGADEALGFIKGLGMSVEQAIPALTNAGFSGTELADALVQTGMSASEASKTVAELTGNASGAKTAVDGLTTGVADTGAAANSATPEMLAFYAAIANFGTIEAVAITIFTVKLPEHAKTGATAMAAEFATLPTQIAPHFGTLESMALTIMATNIPTHAAAGIPFIVAAYSLMTPNIAPFFGELEAMAMTILAMNIPLHAAAGIPFIVAAYSLMTPNIAPFFGELEVLAMTILATNIPMHAASGIPFIVAAFSLLPANIAPFFGELEVLAMTILSVNIPAHAAAMVPLVNAEFGNMLNLATNILLVLAQNSDKTFKAIAGFSIVVPQAVARDFGKAAQDGINLIKAMERGTASSFQTMASNALRTANHVGYIGNAANWAQRQVDALKSAIDGLQDKTVTITVITRYRTVGSPAGRTPAGQFGLTQQVDKPTLFLAGEGAGVETVQITPGTIPAGGGSTIGQNNNVNVDRQVNTQSNVGGSGSIVQSSTNNQVNGVRVNGSSTNTGSGNNSNAVTIVNGNTRIMIGSDGSVSIVSGNQTITTGPNGTSIVMSGNSPGANGNGIRNSNPNPADTVQNGNQVVSGGSIVGQNNNVNVQSDTNTNNNTNPNGTITQTQTNTQNPAGVSQQTQTNTGQSINNNTTTNVPQNGTTRTQTGPGYSQSATVVSGSGQSTNSGHNIAYQRNNSGERLVIDGQTYEAVSSNGQGTSSPSETEFRRRRQTGSNAGPAVRTVVEQDLVINVNVDKYKLGRTVRKLMYDMEEGLYR